MRRTYTICICCLLILVSCYFEEEPMVTCPGFVKTCSGIGPDTGSSGPICWEEWRPCPEAYVPAYAIYPLFNSFSTFEGRVGDTIQVELIYDYFKYDSLIFIICGDLFSRKVLPNEVVKSPGSSDRGIAFQDKIILDKNLIPGNYQYAIEVWAAQKLVKKIIKDIHIYPPFKIEATCIDGKKRSLIIYPPSDTPSNANLEIKEVTSLQNDRWDFEEDSVFVLTKFDELQYCIAIDFRASENFHLLIDGECIKEPCCNNCSIFFNIPSRTIYPVEELKGIIPQNKKYVCRFD